MLDALGLARPIVWGHSDGAVIALRLGLTAPSRVAGIIAEATHFFRDKPASRAFFETMRDAPDLLGDRVTAVLEHDHGAGWRHLIHLNGAAWLGIGREHGDLYDGRLSELRVPTFVVHGERDPRTEPRELDALRQALGAGAVVDLLPTAGHSPHSERATSDEVTRRAVQWISEPRGRFQMIAFDHVTREFESPAGSTYIALDDVSVTIAAGTFSAIVGPSGCGKSTLLNIAAGLLPASRGTVSVAGAPLDGLNRRATYMFQQDALLPWKDVRENVALGLMLAGTARREASERADAWLAARRPRPVRATFPGAAFRRDAQARRDGAELDHRSRHRADGRAVQRAGHPHAPADGNRAAGALGDVTERPSSS